MNCRNMFYLSFQSGMKSVNGIRVNSVPAYRSRTVHLNRRVRCETEGNNVSVIRLYNVKVPIHQDPGKDDFTLHSHLSSEIGKRVRLSKGKTLEENVRIVRKAFDSRKQERKYWAYVVDIPIDLVDKTKLPRAQSGQLEFLNRKDVESFSKHGPAQLPEKLNLKTKPVVVIGSGPAGLFAALRMASSGIKVVLLERGQRVEHRGRDIGALFARRVLNSESNLCYGEGGAGTWSDGKLTTRIGRNDDPVRQVLHTLVLFGAPEEILYASKPHLGTDRLVKILQSFREHLLKLHVDIRFGTKVQKLKVAHGKMQGVILDDGSEMECDTCVMAVGHSARELYTHLYDIGVAMEAKPFAMGFRVEHPQTFVDTMQYGQKDASSLVQRGKGPIPVADYRLATNIEESNSGVYSFCMCPGGQIVNTSTNESELCINGMSFSRRNSVWANSALVCTVNIADWGHLGDSPLLGVELQRIIERKAAIMGGGSLVCPVQRADDFLEGVVTKQEKLPSSSYRLGINSAALHSLYSDRITSAIKKALLRFERTKPGFLYNNALLHAPETRTSAPVQVTRDHVTLESISIQGLFPSGEGAGYAGGIISAAVDGIRVGDAVVTRLEARVL